MNYPIESLKNLLVSAIKAIPDDIPAWTDASKSSLGWVSVRNKKRASLQRIGEASRLWDLFSDRKVIALVGNVNAGKSSLGNFLMGKGASEVFAEDDIRATAQATMADFDGHLLIDLPGLGSIASEKDDKVVAEYVLRSDLLVIVHHIGSDMDPVLYQFLQDVAEGPQRHGQRVVFVFNKTDTLAPASLAKNLESTKSVLLDGAKGFVGIRRLFAYELPMVPFSVFDARSGLLPDQPLRAAIGEAMAASGGSSKQKNWSELKAIRDEWSSLQVFAAELKALVEQCFLDKKAHRDSLLQELSRGNTLENQITLIHNMLDNIAGAALTSMGQLPGPDYIEKSRKAMFGPGPKYTQKRDAFGNLCVSTVQTLENTYNESLSHYLYTTAGVITAYYPQAGVPDISSMDHGMLPNFQTLLHTKRDQYLDLHFDGQKTADSTYQQRIKQQLEKIRSSYPKTVKSYQQLMLTHIENAYAATLAECAEVKTLAETLDPFGNFYQQTTTLIRQAETPEKPSSQPVSREPYQTATSSSGSSNTMIWVVVVILIIIVLVVVLK